MKVDIKVRPVFAWWDVWVGVYLDRKASTVYVLPLPCIGIAVKVTVS